MRDGDPDARSAPRPFLLEDPAWAERREHRRRLLRRLVGVIVVTGGLAAAVAIASRVSARRAAVARVVTEDLERLGRAEAAYFRDQNRFATLDELGVTYIASQGVRVSVERVSARGWAARGWHVRTGMVCRIAGDERGSEPVDCG